MSENNRTLRGRVFKTDFGWCALVASHKGLKRFIFGEKKRLLAEKRIRTLEAGHTLSLLHRDDHLLDRAVSYVKEYFSEVTITNCANRARDIRRRFSHQFDIDLSGKTSFERKVLRLTMRIPYGHTHSYSWIARKAGRAGAARAVGNTLRKNPLPIFVPCHRVVRSDGSPGEYSGVGGGAMKRRLLQREASMQV